MNDEVLGIKYNKKAKNVAVYVVSFTPKYFQDIEKLHNYAPINSKLQHPPPLPDKACTFELLKIGSFKFPTPRAKIVFKFRTLSSALSAKCPTVKNNRRRLLSPGGYSTDAWVGRCGPGVQTLTLFKTQFSDFPIPLKTEFKISRQYLRHLTQNHTLFKTRMK